MKPYMFGAAFALGLSIAATAHAGVVGGKVVWYAAAMQPGGCAIVTLDTFPDDPAHSYAIAAAAGTPAFSSWENTILAAFAANATITGFDDGAAPGGCPVNGTDNHSPYKGFSQPSIAR